jgi:hypothetical protein
LALFGRKFVDDAENQPAILEGRSLPVEDNDNADDDADADVDADDDDKDGNVETTKLPSTFVRLSQMFQWRAILTGMKL